MLLTREEISNFLSDIQRTSILRLDVFFHRYLSPPMIQSLISLPLLSFLALYTFGQTEQTNEDEHYFEGKVEYAVTYESLTPYRTTADFTANSPNKKIIYYKQGSSKTESYLNDKLLSTSWFNVETNKSYLEKVGSDTIYFYDVGDADFDFSEIEVSQGEKIVGYETTRVSISMSGKKGTFYHGSTGSLSFEFATDLKSNPKWFENFREFNYCELIKIAPGIYLREIDRIDGYRIQTNEATDVSEQKVELNFSSDPEKTYIEI